MGDRAGGRDNRKYRWLFLIAFFVVITLFGSVFLAGITLERTLLARDFYVELMDDLKMHTRLRKMLLKSALKAEEELLLPGSLIEHAVTETLCAEWIREKSMIIVDEIISFVRDGGDRLTVAVNLENRKAVFQEALIGSLSSTEMEKLDLTESFVEEFIENLELPDRLTLLQVDAAALAAGDARVLQLIRQREMLLRIVPAAVIIFAAGFCFLWAGTAGGLIWCGGALAAGGAVYHLLLQAAAKAVNPPGIEAGCAVLDRFFVENPDVLPALLERFLSDQAAVVVYYAGAGGVLLAAGLLTGLAVKAAGRIAAAKKD